MVEGTTSVYSIPGSTRQMEMWRRKSMTREVFLAATIQGFRWGNPSC